MSTNLILYANTGLSDLEYGVSASEWTEIDPDNDEIIFSAGSDTVDDGEPSPSDTQLNSAGILLTGSNITVDRYFLNDASAGILKEIHLAGAGNYQYVFACSFDGVTASEPRLELWDNTDMDSIDLVSLGEGTASNSWFRGITTTTSAPGVAWTGSRLAGSSDGHYLYLNDQNGALSGADVLYFQLKCIIPSTQVDAGAELPVLVIKYSTT